MSFKLKWSTMGMARLWWAMSEETTNPISKEKYLQMSYDCLFLAAMYGELE